MHTYLCIERRFQHRNVQRRLSKHTCACVYVHQGVDTGSKIIPRVHQLETRRQFCPALYGSQHLLFRWRGHLSMTKKRSAHQLRSDPFPTFIGVVLTLFGQKTVSIQNSRCGFLLGNLPFPSPCQEVLSLPVFVRSCS